jgi:hypothetical protein
MVLTDAERTSAFVAACERRWPGAMLVARPNKKKRNYKMAFEPKNDSGSLFRNDRRESDSHPEYRGDGIVNGEAVWINAWVKESKKTGKKFFSLSFRQARARGPQPAACRGFGGFDSVLVFNKRLYASPEALPYGEVAGC